MWIRADLVGLWGGHFERLVVLLWKVYEIGEMDSMFGEYEFNAGCDDVIDAHVKVGICMQPGMVPGEVQLRREL